MSTQKNKYQFQVLNFPKHWSIKKILNNILNVFKKEKILKANLVILSVSCVNRKEIKKLNFKYRKKNTHTDILSFESEQKTPVLVGELILCKEVVKEQAKKMGHTIKKELEVLLVHGILHLLGFDHEKSKIQEKKMKILENKILKKLNSSSGLISRVS
jgi:probable rRNA maturation factor